MMNAKTKFAAALVSAMILGACSNGDDLVGINSDCSNLSGVFKATSATVTGTGSGNNSTVDLLANNGSFNLTLGTGAYSSSYTAGASSSPLIVSGTLTTATAKNVSTGQSFFADGGSGSAFDCKINGNTLTLDAPNSTFTFAGQTEPTPADVRIVLTKQSED